MGSGSFNCYMSLQVCMSLNFDGFRAGERSKDMVNVPDDGVNVPIRYKVGLINGHNDNGRIPFKN